MTKRKRIFTAEQRERKRIYDKERYLLIREKQLEYAKVYNETNKEKRAKYYKEYITANKDKLRKQHKKYRLENKDKLTAYRTENKDKLRAYNNNYVTTRMKLDPQYKLAFTLRSRLRSAIRFNYKAGSAVRDLGCSVEEFKTYIEDQFQEGMSWENHGEWHLDHIIPLSAFDLTNRDEFLIACHFTNYQPLWATDNIRKGSKICDIT